VSTAPTGLRERKKLECRRSLVRAARELASSRGVGGFTIDDVVAAANVSPRTFFNYFTTKEEAIIGHDPQRVARMATLLLERPRHESPLLALRNTLVDDVGDIEANAAAFAERTALVHRCPELMPRHLSAVHAVEQALAAAMAERLRVDPTVDPYPTLVVAVSVATLSSTMLWWQQNGRPGELAALLADAFARLAGGMPRRR
jgi:AcrR family transcriptional regulator